MISIKQQRRARRLEMRAYLKTLTPQERAEADKWNDFAVEAVRASEENRARLQRHFDFTEKPYAASRQTLFGRADDKLSRLAGRIVTIRRNESQAFDDPITQSAPTECYSIISDGFDRQLEEAARACGFADYGEAMNALEARTTSRWMYFAFQGELCQS